MAHINQLRALHGLKPLARWTSAETCTTNEAKTDKASGNVHGAFGACGEMAQNACPDWPSSKAVVEGCLHMMWCEGPGPSCSWTMSTGHYMNMTNPAYTQVACGFYTISGKVWGYQNFK